MNFQQFTEDPMLEPCSYGSFPGHLENRSRGGSLRRAISQTSIGRSLTHSSVLSRKSSTSESVLRGLLGM